MTKFDEGNKADEEMITLVIEALWDEREMGREAQARAVWYSLKARLNRERPKVADRKKEVIEIITNYLDNAVINARAVTSYIPGCVAEEVYDRIAPLMAREFPEGNVKSVLYMLISGTKVGEEKEALELAINHLKQIYNGGGTIVCSTKMTPEKAARLEASGKRMFEEGRRIAKEAGLCQKCGGSGLSRLTSWDEEQRHGEVLDCPQCEGTGEERRKGGERREGIMPASPEKCDHCKYYDYEDGLCKRHAPVTEPIEAELGSRHLNVQRPIWPKMELQVPRWCGDYVFLDRRTRPERRKHPEKSL